MPKKPKVESRYVDEFRRLGFEKDNHPLPRAIRRESHALHRGGLLKPTFSAFPHITFVTDETGQRWVANTYVDLTHLGFRNNVTGAINKNKLM